MANEPVFPAKYLVNQGAEARVYQTEFLGRKCIVKERFSKAYRHPTLDASLTTRRTNTEVRCLTRCRQLGLDTPALFLVDKHTHRIYMEYVEGVSCKEALIKLDTSKEDNWTDIERIGRLIGSAVASMHAGNIVHGDLTTSNLMIRSSTNSLVVIDFGLSYVSHLTEDKAVDIYVLERALLSTHANAEKLFDVIMKQYHTQNKGAAKPVIKKFEEVRLRGRKRDMIG